MGEGATYGINGNFAAPKKRFSINLVIRQRQNFVWVYISDSIV